MQEGKEIVKTDPHGHALVEYTAEQMEVIKKHIAPNCPTIELQFLVEKSKLSGMNVMKGECHFVPAQQWDSYKRTYITKWSVQTSIDFYRKRGIGTGKIDWHSSNPYFIRNDKGEPREMLWRNLPDKGYPPHPDYAKALIKRKDMSQPLEHIVYWNEYAKMKKDGNLQAMWAKMPGNQLSKVAEAGCWRKAVPEFEGVYISDEMPPSQEPTQFGKTLKPVAQGAIENKTKEKESETKEKESEKEPPKEIAQEAKSESEIIASLLMELSQCENAEQVNKWFTTHKKDLDALSQPNRDQVNQAFKQRMAELVKEIKKEAEKKEETKPTKEDAKKVKEDVVDEARHDLAKDAPKPRMVTDNALRLVMKICFTLEDTENNPYITSEEECKKFILFSFKKGSIENIKLEDATRFIARFNNFKDQAKLMELFFKFKNAQGN